MVTRAFEKLAQVVANGERCADVRREILPHPLNPLPDDRVKAILREHLRGIVGQLMNEREERRS